MATWPGSLPALPLLRGWQETAPDTIIRSTVDNGPAKLRQRFTAGVRPFQFGLLLTAAQVATLDTFYVTTLAGGSLPFDWTNARTGGAVSYRFVSPPAYTSHDQFYHAALSLEVMP